MKPILFNTDMVRAILSDHKSMTRRVVKQCHVDKFIIAQNGELLGSFDGHEPYPTVDDCHYQPGDILYVRETWTIWNGDYAYKADVDDGYGPFCSSCTLDICAGDCNSALKWRPSIHMPREAARLFLRVTDVRVERLQDITEEQAVREGVYRSRKDYGIAIYAFSDLWDSTLKKSYLPLYGWDANPWVWVIEFERIGREDL